MLRIKNKYSSIELPARLVNDVFHRITGEAQLWIIQKAFPQKLSITLRNTINIILLMTIFLVLHVPSSSYQVVMVAMD